MCRSAANRLSRRRSRGLAVVEAAIVLPLFLLLMFAIIDFGRLFFTEITLQHAMREGGRFGVTGERLPSDDDPKTLQSRLQSIRQVVKKAAIGVPVDPSGIVVTSAVGGAASAGGPGDTVTISMTYTFFFITPVVGQFFDDGSHTFTVSTSFRNEPFPPGST